MQYTLETFPGPGIYFGLDENLYHSLPYCGSSNIKKLYSSPPDYWFESHMNPLREVEPPSYAQKFGSAIHACILYGEETFKKTYAYVAGEDGETVSAEGLKDWIKAQGGTPAKLKADNEKMIVDDFGIHLLTEKIYNRVMVSKTQILKNPHLIQAFLGGWPEVSVFWNDDGVPCKARFDYLKLQAIVDLKSFSSKERIMKLDGMIISDIKKYLYQVQASHYIAGHAAAKQLVAEGKVFAAAGAMRPTDEWLTKAFKDGGNFVLVFHKSDGMPVSKAYQIKNGSAWHVDGSVYSRVALENYRSHMERFGPESAWVLMDEPYNLEEEDFKWQR